MAQVAMGTLERVTTACSLMPQSVPKAQGRAELPPVLCQQVAARADAPQHRAGASVRPRVPQAPETASPACAIDSEAVYMVVAFEHGVEALDLDPPRAQRARAPLLAHKRVAVAPSSAPF